MTTEAPQPDEADFLQEVRDFTAFLGTVDRSTLTDEDRAALHRLADEMILLLAEHAE